MVFFLINEYFIDRNTGILYYYKSPTANSNDEISVSNVSSSPLFTIRDTKNVKVKGLTFKNTMNAGISVFDSENTVIDNCTVCNIASYGVNLIGGKNNVFKNGHIYNTDGGAQISGGDEETLTPANNAVINSEIENFSRISKAYRPAVMVSGVGQKVMNNEIHYGEHNA